MINSLKYLSFGVVFLLMLSCQGGNWVDSMSGEYNLYIDGAPYVMIIRKQKDIKAFSSNVSNLHHIKRNIYSFVTEIGYDDNFILVIQRPNQELHNLSIAFELRATNPEEKCFGIADSLIKHDPFFQNVFTRDVNYWIISHSNDSLYGPYSEEEYMKTKELLRVPKDIELRATTGGSIWNDIWNLIK